MELHDGEPEETRRLVFSLAEAIARHDEAILDDWVGSLDLAASRAAVPRLDGPKVPATEAALASQTALVARNVRDNIKKKLASEARTKKRRKLLRRFGPLSKRLG